MIQQIVLETWHLPKQGVLKRYLKVCGQEGRGCSGHLLEPKELLAQPILVALLVVEIQLREILAPLALLVKVVEQ